jgi:hypothetical protein
VAAKNGLGLGDTFFAGGSRHSRLQALIKERPMNHPPDVLRIDILQGGSVRITTGPVSHANHADLVVFLHSIGWALGGQTIRRRHPDAPPLPEAARDAFVRTLTDALVADHRRRIAEQQAPNQEKEEAPRGPGARRGPGPPPLATGG